MNNYGGYRNYTEWKNSDPTGYWAYINAKYERIKSGEKDSLWRDEDFEKLIDSLPDYRDDKNPFDSFTARHFSNKSTLWDIECQKIVDTGEAHPLHEVFSRYMDGVASKKDLKKIGRINNGLNPDIWFVRLWKWVKKKIGF